MQFVLGRAHEELTEKNKAPSVVGEQLVQEAPSHFFDILDKSNQSVILVQESIMAMVTLSIQLCHHLSHSAVLVRPTVCISKLIVGASPTRCKVRSTQS